MSHAVASDSIRTLILSSLYTIPCCHGSTSFLCCLPVKGLVQSLIMSLELKMLQWCTLNMTKSVVLLEASDCLHRTQKIWLGSVFKKKDTLMINLRFSALLQQLRSIHQQIQRHKAHLF